MRLQKKWRKDLSRIDEELAQLPPECFLTDEECDEAFALLKANK